MMQIRPIQRRRTKRRSQPLPVEILLPRQGEHCILGSAQIPLQISPGSVQTHNHNLIEILQNVNRHIQENNSIELDETFYKETMRNLRGIGLSAYGALGDDFVREFDRQETKAGGPGLILTIKGEVTPLLWEVLYTGKSRGPVEPDKFWGFQHRLTRFQLGSNAIEETEIDPATDFLFCHHHGLAHSLREKDALHTLVAPCFNFRLLDEAFAGCKILPVTDNLSEHFIDLLDMLELGALHLACHCTIDPNQSGILFSELALSYQTTVFRFKLHELKAAWRDYKFSLAPLVFLNACQTQTNPEYLLQGDSFPGGFLRFGASGVVATACDVHDLFATEFAKLFYQNLFENNDGRSPTVSEALYKTRRHFIEPPYCNPLGLAYGLYARSELHIVWDWWDDDIAGDDDEAI